MKLGERVYFLLRQRNPQGKTASYKKTRVKGGGPVRILRERVPPERKRSRSFIKGRDGWRGESDCRLLQRGSSLNKKVSRLGRGKESRVVLKKNFWGGGGGLFLWGLVGGGGVWGGFFFWEKPCLKCGGRPGGRAGVAWQKEEWENVKKQGSRHRQRKGKKGARSGRPVK